MARVCRIRPRVDTRTGRSDAPRMDEDLTTLRQGADEGDSDAADQLIELAGERGDIGELRRLADQGWSLAEDEPPQVAAEQNNLDELRRLAATGNTDAADVLDELTGEE